MENTANNIVQLFESRETFNTVITRTNSWSLNLDSSQYRFRTYRKPDHRTDFAIEASHDHGNQPFSAVTMSVYVDKRSSPELYNLNKKDCLALAAMFTSAAATLADTED